MALTLSKKASEVKPSSTLAITAKAKALKAQGVDLVGFGAGEPDFNTPDNINDVACEAIRNGFTKYTPASGIEDLKKAVSEKFKTFNKVDYGVDQIVISNGGKHSLTNIFTAIINEGDEVVIPAPFWLSYPEIVKLAGGVPVIVTTTPENDFKITAQQLAEACTDKTKAFVLNSPNNPTGMIYTREELEALAKVIVEKDIYVVADEMYEYLIYGEDEHVSIASLGKEIYDHTITCSGLSKSYAMTGWRIGFIAGPEWIVKACNKLQGQYTSGPCSVSQKAAEAAYVGTQEPVKEMQKAFERRRDLIVKLAKEVPGFEVNVPQGAFYLFPKCSYFFGKSNGERKIENSDDLAMYLLEDAHVACVGGTSFGAPECIRMSYATSDENIVEAIRRIKEALAKLK